MARTPYFPQSQGRRADLGIPLPRARRAELRRGAGRWPCLSPAPGVWSRAAPPWALAAGCAAPCAGSTAARAPLENPRGGSILVISSTKRLHLRTGAVSECYFGEIALAKTVSSQVLPFGTGDDPPHISRYREMWGWSSPVPKGSICELAPLASAISVK